MIYIIGTGYHSTVVKDILLSLDLQNGNDGKTTNIETIAFDNNYNFNCNSHDQYICGVGDNYTRKKLYQNYPNLNWINAIHPSVVLSPTLKIGVGNVICAGVTIQPHVEIGNHCIINTSSSVDHHCIIKDYCHIAPKSVLCGNITMYEGSFIGAGSTVVPGNILRPWSFTKANSLVKNKEMDRIPIYEPKFRSESALKAIEEGWISSIGRFVGLAENRLQEFLGVNYVILTNSGTSAVHCCVLALKKFHPEVKKIYVPDCVYIAVYNTILYEYPIEYLEVLPLDPESWNADFSDDTLDSLQKGSAVMIAHNIGNVINVPRLKRKRPDLIFIEDNCEGFTGKYEGKYTGTESFCSAISFFANKTITSGQGGAFCTNSYEVAKWVKKLVMQSQTTVRYLHDDIGYNYKITNVQAAILYDQLEDLDSILSKKKEIFGLYKKLLGEDRFQKCEEGCEPAAWILGCIFNTPLLHRSDSTLSSLKTHPYSIIPIAKEDNIKNRRIVYDHFLSNFGIETRMMFFPWYYHNHLKRLSCHERYYESVANMLQVKCILLPSYPDITDREVEYICESLFNAEIDGNIKINE